jgi:hypothetical protein
LFLVHDENKLKAMTIIMQIKKLWHEHPLWVILSLAILFRVLAAFFARGFGMHDDHFQVIEVAQGWLDGKNIWFDTPETIRRSLVYPGLHYILFSFLERISITDPQAKMLIVRLIHALYSLLIVIYGYLIARRISDIKTANKVGLLLAVFWILPFMSVRNLIEVVCIPPMMGGFYYTLKKDSIKNWYIAGLLFGLSVILRYQLFMMVGGLMLVLIILKKFRAFAAFGLGALTSLFFIEGIVNWIAWGSPVKPIVNYVIYNIQARNDYVTGPFYNYLLLLIGALIPPISFFWLYGFLHNWKKYAILFWPVFLLIAAHSYFPNKQERFILPVLPILLVLGYTGWERYIEQSRFWQSKTRFLKACWIWFWAINTILLIVVTFTYSKKTRVETLYFLSHKNDITGVVWESYNHSTPFIPLFYLNHDVPVYEYPQTRSAEELIAEFDSSASPRPNYIIFLGEKDIDRRVRKFEIDFKSSLHLEKKVNPSLIDAILYRLNPRHNVNQVSYVYRIDYQ